MKHRVLRIMGTISLCIILIYFLSFLSCTVYAYITFSTCNPDDFFPLRGRQFEAEYFTFYYTDVDFSNERETTSGEFAIMELTEKGKEQERIAIPSHIYGLPVTDFGLARSEALWGYSIYHFESDHLKKVILPYTVERMIQEALHDVLNLKYLIYPGMCDSSEWYFDLRPHYANKETQEPITVFVAYNNFSNIDDYRVQHGQKNVVAIANVTYNLNYEGAVNEGIYTLDQVEEEEIIIEPEVPKREGYAFQGWYKEVNCITGFDFEKDRVQKDESLGTMMLYAKWEKV